MIEAADRYPQGPKGSYVSMPRILADAQLMRRRDPRAAVGEPHAIRPGRGADDPGRGG